VVLDQGRVQVERHRLPPEQRLHTPKQAVKSAVELTDVTEVEAREKPPQRGRVRHRVTAQLLLRRVGTQQRRIVEILAADDQRLAQRQHLLRRRIAARPVICCVEEATWTSADRPASFTLKSASLSPGWMCRNTHAERQGGRLPDRYSRATAGSG
jgi:hypothetical protein